MNQERKKLDDPINNRQLLGKVNWEIQLHLRKFVEVAEKAMANDVWHQHMPHETRQWIREWYPWVKDWLKELKQMQDKLEYTTGTSHRWDEALFNQCNRPDFRYFIASALMMLKSHDSADDISANMSRRIHRLGNLQRDIEAHNFSRLWMAEY
ncbi:MAG: hypothetical protein QNJ45_28355 [Ardenticatenaceae bacterium]|nr:hypothetical protein [Ardenticatenaceae bacterium]